MVVLMATAYGEASEVAHRVPALESEVIAVRRARDAAEEEILSLAAKTATTEQ
jgi:hypothetical protein